jgi:hypothetical protein
MARPGQSRLRRRAAPHPTPARIPHEPPVEPAYVGGFIEFLDKRWSRAEADVYSARRSVFLLSSVAIGCSIIILSLSVAAAGFVGLVMFMHARLGSDAGLPLAALFGTVGAAWFALARRRRVSRRRRDRLDSTPDGGDGS